MKRAPILLMTLALAACGGGEQVQLQAELEGLSKDLKGRVDPLPVVKPYEPVPYQAFELPDPFGESKLILATKKGSGGGLQPDLNRPKEPLEAFPLETLKMVGTLQQNKRTYALVVADAGLYKVGVGNYLGQNYGLVTRIADDGVALRELVQDAAGDWTERDSTLVLQEADTKASEAKR